MGKSQRTKGHGFERNIAVQLRSIFPKCRRNLEYYVTKDDEQGVDIDHTDEFRFQCKATKRYVPLTEHAKIAPSARRVVRVLIAKADRKETLAVLPFKEFKKLLAAYKGKKGKHRGKKTQKETEEKGEE